MRMIVACISLAAATLPATLHAAEDIGVVAAAPSPGPNGELIELNAQLRRAFLQRKPSALNEAQLVARMGGDEKHPSLTETDRMYHDARTFYLAGEPHRAAEELRATLATLEQMPEGASTLKQWIRAMFLLATIESSIAGHEAQAIELLERIVRTDPTIKIDADAQGPELVRQFKRVNDKVALLPTYRLTISSPPGTELYLNGRKVENSGAEAIQLVLAKGQYRLSAIQGNVRIQPIQVNLEKDEELTLDFEVPKALRPLNGPGLAASPVDQELLFKVGAFLRLKLLVVTQVIIRDQNLYFAASAYDIGKKSLQRAGVVRLQNASPFPGAMEALMEFLSTGAVADKSMVAPYNPLEPLPRDDLFGPTAPTALSSKSLGWVAFGAGIGAVTLGGVSAWQFVSSSTYNDKANRLLRPDGSLPPDRSQYDQFISDRDQARRNGTYALVGAGICVGASILTGYLAYKQTGEVGPFRF